MSVVRTSSLLLMILLGSTVSGVKDSDAWSVQYSSLSICAMKTSTVTFCCSYTLPAKNKMTKIFWTKGTRAQSDHDFSDLSDDEDYRVRTQFQCFKQICSFRLSHVTEKDSHMFYFRIVTDKPADKWIGAPGVNLTVTDIQLESPDIVMEGETVRLMCKISCSPTNETAFIWSRDTQILSEETNTLILKSVSREDSARYRCSVQSLSSDPVLLVVTYPPDDPKISIHPFAELLENTSVTLTCTSDSNPPAEISWWKDGKLVESGRTLWIRNLLSDGRETYTCRSRNRLGERESNPVALKVLSDVHGASWHFWLGIIPVCGLFLVIIILVIIKKSRRVETSRLPVKMDDFYANVTRREQPPEPELPASDDVLHISDLPSRHQTSEVGCAEEILYVTVQCQKENQYDNARRSVEDISVIYSCVK